MLSCIYLVLTAQLVNIAGATANFSSNKTQLNSSTAIPHLRVYPEKVHPLLTCHLLLTGRFYRHILFTICAKASSSRIRLVPRYYFLLPQWYTHNLFKQVKELKDLFGTCDMITNHNTRMSKHVNTHACACMHSLTLTLQNKYTCACQLCEVICFTLCRLIALISTTRGSMLWLSITPAGSTRIRSFGL